MKEVVSLCVFLAMLVVGHYSGYSQEQDSPPQKQETKENTELANSQQPGSEQDGEKDKDSEKESVKADEADKEKVDQEANKDKEKDGEKSTENSQDTAAEKPADDGKDKPTPQEEPSALQKIQALPVETGSLEELQKIVKPDSDVDIYTAAIELLQKIGAEKPLVAALLLQWSAHPNEQVATMAAQAILGTTAAVEQIRSILANSEENKRRAAAKLLVHLGESEVETFAVLLKKDKASQAIASESLSEIGVAAIPILLKFFEDNNTPQIENNLVQIFHKMGIMAIPAMLLNAGNTSDEGKYLLVSAITKSGEEGWQEVIRILRIGRNESIEDVALRATLAIGPELIPAVIALIEDRLPAIQEFSQKALAKFGEQALPLLKKKIREEKDLRKKSQAILAVGYLGTQDREIMIELSELLKNTRNEDIQFAALETLGKMGEAAEEAVPQMIPALQSRNWRIREVAVRAFLNIGEKAKAALPAMISQLSKEEYGDVRVFICRFIGKIGPEAKSAVPVLMQRIKSGDEEGLVIAAAAQALGKIGPEARKAIPTLVDVMVFWGPSARLAAAEALANIGPAAISQLIKTLKYNEDVAAREGAAVALGMMGQNANRAASGLILALRFDVDLVKIASATALGKIGFSRNAVKALIEAVQNEPQLVREPAAQAILQMGPKTIPHLISGLSALSSEARMEIVKLLGEFGDDAAPAINSLVDRLRLWRGAEREEIVKILPKLGESGKKAIPLLVSILGNEYSEKMQSLLADSLIQLGPEVIPHVLPLLVADRPGVQKTASAILAKMQDSVYPYLVEIVTEKTDEMLVCKAVEILGQNPAALDVLLGLLKHKSEKVRTAAILAVAENGEDAVEKLIAILVETKIFYEREAASEVLSMIGPVTIPALSKILLENDDSNIRMEAIRAISRIGTEAKEAIPHLLQAIVEKKRKGEEGVELAKCLGKIGVIAIPQILKLLESQDEYVQSLAIFALGETNSKEAIVYLLQSLESSPTLLSLVVNATVKMKNLATPILIDSLSADNEHIRFACAAALFEIAPEGAVEQLAKRSVTEKNPMVRHMVEIALKKCQQDEN